MSVAKYYYGVWECKCGTQAKDFAEEGSGRNPQNSLRVLPDFFGGILAGRALRKETTNIEILAKPRYRN